MRNINMPPKTKVLIADDHPIFRQGLIKALEVDKSLEIVAECGDGDEALKKIKELKPDVAVLDISMPGKNGLDIVRQIKKQDKIGEFIILTMYKDEEYFNEALDIGVKGYLLKDNAVSDLMECLKSVVKGKYYVSPLISDYLVNRNVKKKELIKEKPSIEDLTETERKILRLIAENKTSKEIAKQLFISYRTVQNHRNNICNKLGLKGYNKLLQFALQNRFYL